MSFSSSSRPSSGPDKKISKRKQKRARKEALEDLEEEQLTSLIFGSSSAAGGGGGAIRSDEPNYNEGDYFVSHGSRRKFSLEEDEEQAETGGFAFEIDRVGQNVNDGNEMEDGQLHQGNDTSQILVVYGEDNEEDADDGDDDDERNKRNTTAKPAWIDHDDQNVTVDIVNNSSRLKKLRKSRDETGALALDGNEFERRLRQRYEQTTQATARTDWARLDDTKSIHAISQGDGGGGEDDDDDDDDDKNITSANAAADLFGSTSAPLLATSRHRLPPNILNIVRCPDANLSDPNDAVVQAVNFHPASDVEKPLLLTAGLDKTLRFFQVGPDQSEKIHGIHFPKMPIYSASFLGDSGNVVVSGRRPFFYIYDAVAGKVDLVPRIMGRSEKSWERHVASPNGDMIAFLGNDGYIVLVDTHSKHWIADLKMNGSVRSLAFTPDGSHIVSSGSDGDVYRWDLRSRRCVERFSNNDGTITSSLATSSGNLAVGSESGVVNLYSEHPSRQTSNKDYQKDPIKSIMNLHTSADFLRFNHDGQILAMSTRREKHGMKLLHVPSRTVFSNWPTSKTPLNYVWSMDFSPQSQFLAVGNDKGKCLLYRLLHYEKQED